MLGTRRATGNSFLVGYQQDANGHLPIKFVHLQFNLSFVGPATAADVAVDCLDSADAVWLRCILVAPFDIFGIFSVMFRIKLFIHCFLLLAFGRAGQPQAGEREK